MESAGTVDAQTVVSELARLRREVVEGHPNGLYLAGLYAGLHDLARAHPELAGVVAERTRLWALALAPDAVARGHWSLRPHERNGAPNADDADGKL